MIKVYQIRLTDEEIADVNAHGWDVSPKTRAYADLHSFDLHSFERTFSAESFQYYDLAAEVDTNDMEEAFGLMNMWDEPERVHYGPVKPFSMSVGDILETEDGSRYRCATFGFTALEV